MLKKCFACGDFLSTSATTSPSFRMANYAPAFIKENVVMPFNLRKKIQRDILWGTQKGFKPSIQNSLHSLFKPVRPPIQTNLTPLFNLNDLKFMG